jgi:hypothetical protein
MFRGNYVLKLGITFRTLVELRFQIDMALLKECEISIAFELEIRRLPRSKFRIDRVRLA